VSDGFGDFKRRAGQRPFMGGRLWPDPGVRERQLLGGPLTGTTTPGSPNAISPIGRGTDQKVSLVDPPAAMTVGVRQTMSRKRPGGDTQLPLRGR